MLIASVILLCLHPHGPLARQGELSNEHLVRQGKDATALVVVNNLGMGTAFCVEKHGWFITNQHVVRGARGEIKLILQSGLKAERIIKARVVRQDEKHDLALLRSEEPLDLPALALSPSGQLTELTEIIAFGFPFGSALSLASKENPAISVNVGKVTAMRRSQGELRYVQVDALLNRGNSGGPLLNRQGKVVGIVVAGIEGTGVNLAIPAEHAIALMQKPDVQLRLPKLEPSQFDRQAEFQATVTSLLESPNYEVTLRLRLDDQPERALPMKLEKGVFRAQAVPVPATTTEKPITVTVQYADGTVTGKTPGSLVKILDKTYHLRDIKEIQFQPTLLLTLSNGQQHRDINPLGKQLTITLGGQAVPLDLAQVKALRFIGESPPQTLSVTVIVRQDGKEVASATESLFVGSTSLAGSGAAKDRLIQQPAMEQHKLERQLPSTIGDAVLGGGGRFILLQLPQVRQVAVFDVSQARVVKYLPVDDDDAHITAGMDKLFIAMNGKRVLQRWDLETLTLETTVPLPCRSVHFILMGHASHGPLILSKPRENDNGTIYLNTETLQPLPVLHTKEIGYDVGFGRHWRVSGDGTILVGWTHGLSPASLDAHILKGMTLHRYQGSPRLAYCLPGRDGKVLFSNSGLFTQECVQLGGTMSGSYALPATSGEWYLTITPTGNPEGRNRPRQQSTPVSLHVALHVVGRAQELVSLPQLDLTGIPLDVPYKENLLLDKRVFFVPEAKVLVTLPVTNDRLVIQRLNVDEALEQSSIDYLFVNSQPPTKATKGEQYQHALQVRSKKGDVKYRLDAGPAGMVLSPNGTITWAIPADYGASTAEVIISITDASKQEVLKSFRIMLLEAGK